MCNRCRPEPYFRLNPTFTDLTIEFQKQKRWLPWQVIFKPSGTISYLSEFSTGIEPVYQSRFIR